MININTIYHGDALEVLKTFPDEFVNCCITSPPYYGLRNYGADKQIGLENDPEEYIEKLVNIFREVKRVLKKDGTLWLNLGDSYNGFGNDSGKKREQSQSITKNRKVGEAAPTKRNFTSKLKPKDLMGIPWRVALALQKDGWYLRQDIIWAKQNCMPESVTDRCTRSHEYVFLLSKNAKYYFDNESIKEPLALSSIKRCQHVVDNNEQFVEDKHKHIDGVQTPMEVLTRASKNVLEHGNRNKRSVWFIPTNSFEGAHFATFPSALIEPMIKAGCPKDGVVLDPFMGSGTVAVVANELKRNWVGIELNIQYIDIMLKRLTNKHRKLI